MLQAEATEALAEEAPPWMPWRLRTPGSPEAALHSWRPRRGQGARLSCGPAAAFYSCKSLHRTHIDSLVNCALHTGDCKVCN